ncbi:hypothetical protein AAE02nite_05720 [Adhaeribacter aerolatus]|uniref:Lantibiotic dehydratase N-terminal domain-containing protein n=1 Tax=Adhaeribacter aerolatus TaxID=670289 RepID=A0A512AT84_9BACT|nr:lantibiotic dehydratase [Adhaeribacter aerolatus]GEO02908.1 hypothetical protein AAE02nite_05720 [Adhaeribacter aerolatus]
MRVFPYLLARIGGGSYEHLTQVDYRELSTRTACLITRRNEKQRLKEQLCAHLFECIKNLPDQKIQNQVQNLRRDIFNQRPVKPQVLATAKPHLPAVLTSEVDEYLVFAAELQAETERAAAIYEQFLYTGRRHLQQLAHDENLQKGLVLSSQSLLNALKDYARQDPDSFRKKEFQTEQSLLKYITRMYTKTSPFSTFNNLALGTLGSLPGKAIQIDANPDTENSVVGHIRLNNNLFKYLKDLFTASKEIYPHLLLRANPTIAQEQDQYVYLTNHNNVDAFQRIPASPVLGLVLQLVQANPAGIRFGALAEEICEYVDAPAENIQSYLRQLTGYGFLEFDLGVSGTDPDWDLKLLDQLAYLAQQQVSHMAALTETLQYIRQQSSQYAQATVPERQRILNEVYQRFRNICMKLHEAAGLPEIERKTPEELQAEWLNSQKEAAHQQKENGRQAGETVLVVEKVGPAKSKEVIFEHKSSTYFSFKPEQLFYEDSIREAAVQVDAEKLSQLVQNLFGLLQEMRPFRGMADEQELMFSYFKKKYGAGSRVNLLQFYEDFYREIKKPEAEWLAKKQQALTGKDNNLLQTNPDEGVDNSAQAELNKELNPGLLTSEQLSQSGQKNKAWFQKMVAALPEISSEGINQVDLSLDFIRQVNQTPFIPAPESVGANSYGAFVQLYQEQDETGEWQLKGVLNASLAGYGKMLSRFLYILPKEVTQTVRGWNSALQPQNSLFIENGDASYFNANLHPPLMPAEIRIPGGHNSLPVAQQFPVSDFEVRVDEPAGEIQLFHKETGQRSYVFDLGFQGHSGRSQLFQLLDKFTRAEYLFSYPVVSAVNAAVEPNTVNINTEAANPEPQLIIRPRIVYQNQLVLQRKGWYVPKELIPKRQPDMSDWSYFLAINEWRQSHGIADEVYVTISQNRQQTGIDPELTKKLGRDDYKPQYINFNNPLLAHLFEKLLTKVPHTLKIEEMLPYSPDLLKINNQRFVTEFVVQWYN